MNGIGSIVKVQDSLAEERGEEAWKKPHALVGHSMSGGQTLLFASTFPERLERLVCIEGFGPLTAKEDDAPLKLKAAVMAEDAWHRSVGALESGDVRPPKVYDSVKTAIDARVFVVGKYPGDQHISREAASAIVSRGVSTTTATTTADEGDVDITNENPVRFRHDSRMTLPSPLYMSRGQVLGFTKAVQCRTLLVTADKGWPAGSLEAEQEKVAVMGDKLTHVELRGSHHVHLDPETADLTGETIANFLQST
jgi:pimeloyl-ACP methyl ester carboxylesterase